MASTEPFDVSAVLAALGVNPETAKSLQNKMNGVDYLNLVNALSDDSEDGRNKASQILAKYGIKIRKVPQMENTRLETIFNEMHAGKDYEAAHETAFVRPISEMESPSAAMSGYSSFVRAANDSDAETLRDWLEENEFDYQNNDKHTFLVQSADRERTYRLNHFMGKMNGKTSVMDGMDKGQILANNILKSPFKGEYGEIIATDYGQLRVLGAEPSKTRSGAPDWKMLAVDQNGKKYKIQYDTANAGLYGSGGKFNFDESVVEEKKNMAKDLPKHRNPIAAQVIKKSGGGAHNSKDPSRKDAWSRNAKHKGRSYESIEESVYSQGESVQFEGNDCSVQIPSGPNGTVGLLIDGKVRMVRESDITRVDEGVLGMTKVDPLYRLRELAGVKASAPVVKEDDFGTVDPMADLDVADDFDDADADFGNDDIGGALDDTTDGLGDDFGAPTDDLDGSIGLDTAIDPMADDSLDGDFGSAGPALGGGIPGDVPPMGAGANAIGMVAPVDSEAYVQIQDHLNNIQTSLGDVKLSEYRSLLSKLDALSAQIRSMGRDYLGEQRKLKR